MIYLYLFGTCFHFIYVFMIIINENCDYLSYITYNIWKKGMGNEGIDYIKGKVAQ